MAGEFISPSDRDYAIRTMIGEAANEPDDGLAGVASVILNRTRSGRFGKTPGEVVLQKGQFEPWDTRRDELLSYSDKDPAYQRAAKIFDSVYKGETPDPTKGATHFLNEDIVRQRRGGSLPDWASGTGQKIGAHTFYSPDGAVKVADASNAPVSVFAKYAKSPDVLKVTPGVQSTAAIDPANPGAIPSAKSIFEKYQAPDGAPAETTATVEKNPVQPTPNMTQPSFAGQMAARTPVVGPLMNKLVAGTNAAIDPLFRSGNGTFGERYAANLDQLTKQKEQYSEEHPVAAAGADLAGGTMLAGPMAGTALGARMLGMKGATLGAKVYQGAAGGGAIAGADTVLQGRDPREEGWFGSTPLGMAFGALGPIVGEGVNKLVTGLARIRGPKTGPLAGTNSVTREKMSNAVEGETPASIQEAKTAYGPQGFVGDINQGTRDLTGGLADIPGPNKEVVREAVRERSAGQRDRLVASLDKNTVPQKDVAVLSKALDQAKKDADPLYEQFRTMQIHPTDEIKALVPRLEAAGAFDTAEKLAGIEGKDINRTFFTSGTEKNWPTAETWDLVKRGLDSKISGALDANDKTLYRSLSKLRGEMMDKLDSTDAGKVWKQAREKYAEPAALQEHLEEGQKTFSRATRVDELAQELQGLSGPERAARVQGARDAIQKVIDDTMRGDTTARNLLLSENGKQKMELLFGPQRAGRLTKDLEAELNIAKSRDEIVGGSPTAGKQQRIKDLSPAKGEKGYVDNLKLTEPGTYVPEWMKPRTIMEGATAKRHFDAYQQMAPMLTKKMGDPGFDDLVSSLLAERSRMDAAGVRGARLGQRATGALVAGAPTLRNRLARRPEDERSPP